MFSNFVGNSRIVTVLRRMLTEGRLPQTLLFTGPRGVGKATLASLLAASLNCLNSVPGEACGECSNCRRILAADLSQESFQQLFAERLKLPAAKRTESPLIVSTHPDFLIFPPDGPLQIITIDQARQMRQAAQYGPSEGRRRVFLIDHADRANDESSNSLLKTLEEPAPSLTIVLTAENPNELLPTIRSRAIPFYFAPLSNKEMKEFLTAFTELSEDERQTLIRLAQGSPGRAITLNVDQYLERRDSMLVLLRTSLGEGSFAELLPYTEAVARKSDERLDVLLESFQSLLQDLLHLRFGSGQSLVNTDIADELESLARRASFEWIEKAAAKLDELELLRRRNIQKQIALEAMGIGLRQAVKRE